MCTVHSLPLYHFEKGFSWKGAPLKQFDFQIFSSEMDSPHPFFYGAFPTNNFCTGKYWFYLFEKLTNFINTELCKFHAFKEKNYFIEVQHLNLI